MLIKYKNYCNIKEFIFSRIKHILVPYIVFSLCNALVRILLYGYDESAFIRDVICTFILIGVDTWFLQALFLAEIMFIVIRKIVKNKCYSGTFYFFIIHNKRRQISITVFFKSVRITGIHYNRL